MRLNVYIDDAAYAVDVPAQMLDEAEDFFGKIDADMGRGWQMSRDYVEQPNAVQRCQIVADKLLTSMLNGNKTTALLMAAYILKRMPGVTGVDVDTDGEMQNTELLFGTAPR